MSNPIKAIIIFDDKSGGGDGGESGCMIFMIIAALIVGGVFLDWSWGVGVIIGVILLFTSVMVDKISSFIIFCVVLLCAMWAFGKFQDKDRDAKISNGKGTEAVERKTHEMQSNSGIPKNNKSEQKSSASIEVSDLASIDYPSSFITTSDSQFLAADGQETVIPANTRITILKRTPTGMLTLEASGITYLGYESRLTGNLKK